MVVETQHPRFGKIHQLRSPVRVGAEPPAYARAPVRGEHEGAVLIDLLGYDANRVAELRRGGAFGQPDPAGQG
jgi:crotonobetainyl-CoA:carnitine CoA-transferase CaiB-like acyl-CoA transferase